MANRVHLTPTDADIISGSLPAVRSDWRFGDADSMSVRDIDDPTSDAGRREAGASPTTKLSVSFLNLWGSPHTQGWPHWLTKLGRAPTVRRWRAKKQRSVANAIARGVEEAQ